ncbi:cysteine desulfurase-like protein [Tindallia californiensis]|uniref:Cysteine desulfurase family protein, VC1184 subfamily n=1 Tax=Tindallia californiensis TaxID=159292 RepID=A0A1H3IMZ6_9FIRM|nr:cysteine desulfurase-like protein [Tindallia californiensis]SDY28448.1 cysteine desulfurase family protein, VC1184 subfamily [Tindallia californiensis]
MELFYDIKKIRSQFPALDRKVNGNVAIYLDGPGGTQVPKRVTDKMTNYLLYHNANAHGHFASSRECDALHEAARETMADFLNGYPQEIVFGDSSTTNNLKLTLALARKMKPGDEVIITDLDHESNRSPWLHMQEKGIIVKSIAVDPETCQLDLKDYRNKLTEKTKVVALNWASNGVGTITDIKPLIELAHEKNAITIIDAVHYAPHRPIDVDALGMDFLLCSPYKFFGPHMGVMYGKLDVMKNLETFRVLVDGNTQPPEKMETGTPQFEAICGAAEAVEFIADIGHDCEEWAIKERSDEMIGLKGRRKYIVAGLLAIEEYEDHLAQKMRRELAAIDGVKIYGPLEGQPRTSTISFLIEGLRAGEVAKKMGDEGIFVWAGHYYAKQLIDEVLNLKSVGGLVRIGFAPYNTEEEVNRTIEVVRKIALKE